MRKRYIATICETTWYQVEIGGANKVDALRNATDIAESQDLAAIALEWTSSNRKVTKIEIQHSEPRY
jgi:hypothetical protein